MVGQTTMTRSSSKLDEMRQKRTVPTTTYSGRLATRIRTLREGNGHTVDDFVKAMKKAGYEVSRSTLYGWENGRIQPQIDAFPALARALKLNDVRDLLPEK